VGACAAGLQAPSCSAQGCHRQSWSRYITCNNSSVTTALKWLYTADLVLLCAAGWQQTAPTCQPPPARGISCSAKSKHASGHWDDSDVQEAERNQVGKCAKDHAGVAMVTGLCQDIVLLQCGSKLMLLHCPYHTVPMSLSWPQC
jgi:hypothetical protein